MPPLLLLNKRQEDLLIQRRLMLMHFRQRMTSIAGVVKRYINAVGDDDPTCVRLGVC